MGLFNWKKSGNKTASPAQALRVDMHSHLLPDLDDGSSSLNDTLTMARVFVDMGYSKVITTPHIMGDFFKNTPETILPQLDKVNKALVDSGIPLQMEAAAEYYLDEWFMKKLEHSEPLLCFGEKRYLLFETSYMNDSAYLQEAIFGIKALNYQPILAHPERYTYMYGDFSRYEALFEQGVHFQINLLSLIGHYSPMAKHTAEKLIDAKMIHWLGTDCHAPRHLPGLEKAKKTSYYHKALQLNLLNNTLLT